MFARLFVALATVATLLLAPLSARAEDDAVATVKRIYRAYDKAGDDPSTWPDQLAPKLYSERRRKEIAALKRACAGKDMCLPDFDHMIDGQDWKISGLKVEAKETTATTARVDVSFRNFETAVAFVFTMVKEKGGWKIDQMEGGGEAKYTLDDVLKPNP